MTILYKSPIYVPIRVLRMRGLTPSGPLANKEKFQLKLMRKKTYSHFEMRLQISSIFPKAIVPTQQPPSIYFDSFEVVDSCDVSYI